MREAGGEGGRDGGREGGWTAGWEGGMERARDPHPPFLSDSLNFPPSFSPFLPSSHPFPPGWQGGKDIERVGAGAEKEAYVF